MAAASAADPQSCNAAVLINTSNVEFDWRLVRTFYVQQ